MQTACAIRIRGMDVTLEGSRLGSALSRFVPFHGPQGNRRKASLVCDRVPFSLRVQREKPNRNRSQKIKLRKLCFALCSSYRHDDYRSHCCKAKEEWYTKGTQQSPFSESEPVEFDSDSAAITACKRHVRLGQIVQLGSMSMPIRTIYIVLLLLQQARTRPLRRSSADIQDGLYPLLKSRWAIPSLWA